MRSYFKYLIVLAAFVGPLLVFSMEHSPEAPSTDPQTYKVEGTVFNALTGRPIPRALVQWNSQSGQTSVLSGPGGEFVFERVPQGRAQFFARKPGYFQGRGGSFNQRSILFDVGPDSSKLVIKLTPEAVISGRVLNKLGEPVEGATVRVEKAGASNSIRNRGLFGRPGRTDEDGNFRIAELPPTRYLVLLQPRGSVRRILGARFPPESESYPIVVYYPSADEGTNAEPVSLSAGQHAEINFSIAPRPAYKVSGTITGSAEWKQISPPFFVDRGGQMLLGPDEFDPQTGAFTFRSVVAGTYILRMSAVDQAGAPTIGHQRINVQKDVTGLRLAVTAGIEVPVHVRKELTSKVTYNGNCSYSSPDGKLHTSDCSDYPALQLQLDPVDPTNVPVRSNWGPPAGDALLLRGLQPGKYTVHATASMIASNGYVASLRCGGADLLREGLLVPESGQLPPIEAVLRDDLATLHLLVNADKNSFGSIAILSDADLNSDINPVRRMTYSAEGMLNIPLPPGDYKIFAFTDSADIDINDLEELLLYSKKAVAVTLAAGKTSNLVIDPISTGD